MIDTRLTGKDGRKRDAIVAMACERDRGDGVLWAHCYVPKGWFRRFRTDGEPESIGACRNFIDEALAGKNGVRVAYRAARLPSSSVAIRRP